MIAVDTNLLVYAHRTKAPQHQAAWRALEKASRNPDGWGVALSSITEFWSVVTQSSGDGNTTAPDEATGFLLSLTENGAAIWMPGDNFWIRLTQLAAAMKIQGRRIFDLQIALIAFDNGATELWTHDHAFVSIPGLRVINPLATRH